MREGGQSDGGNMGWIFTAERMRKESMIKIKVGRAIPGRVIVPGKPRKTPGWAISLKSAK